MPNISNYRKTVDKANSQLALFTSALENERHTVAQAKTQIAHVEEAQGILQELAQAVQERAHKQIAQIVSRCLEVIFDDPYEFHIRFEQKRGKTDAVLTFEREGMVLDDPLDESGGGVLDVAAFALRLARLLLARPEGRRLLVLDEPFKLVSAKNQRRVGTLLKMLSEEMDVQIIFVTHSLELRTGKVVEL